VQRSWWLVDEKLAMRWGPPLAAFGAALLVLLVLRQLVVRIARRRAAGPGSFLAVFAGAISVPSVLWALAGATDFALSFADLTKRQSELADQWIGAFIIVSITLVAASFAARVLALYGERHAMQFAVAGLTQTLIRVAIGAVGLMSLLANFGKSITPMLTALGVGGIAVALALQDTLANFFAGIHILVEEPISVGDLIRLESGYEGIVSDIGWRTTRVRTGSNDMVVVPNSKITTGTLVNYSRPDRRTAAEVSIVVAHEADAAEVCRMALEEAALTKGVLPRPEPVCLCDPGVLPTHTQFKLIVNVASRDELGGVVSDLRIRLFERFRADGVPLPAPGICHADRS
jgi:small-conductance mechanosensitive channel